MEPHSAHLVTFGLFSWMLKREGCLLCMEESCPILTFLYGALLSSYMVTCVHLVSSADLWGSLAVRAYCEGGLAISLNVPVSTTVTEGQTGSATQLTIPATSVSGIPALYEATQIGCIFFHRYFYWDNLHNIKFAIFKYIYSIAYAFVTTNSRTFSLPREETCPHQQSLPSPPLPPIPGNLQSPFCLWVCLFWTFPAKGPLSVSGFFNWMCFVVHQRCSVFYITAFCGWWHPVMWVYHVCFSGHSLVDTVLLPPIGSCE